MNPAELTIFERRLRQAGAPDDEIAGFEQTLRDQTPAELAGSNALMRSASDQLLAENVISWRRGSALRAREPRPLALFPGAKPVRAPETLRQLSRPGTTIDTVTIDPRQGWCRVVATVTHPPASDQVRVYVALPVEGWNGRFLGTGGGGFAGGSPTNLRDAAAMGFAVAATDTGHDGSDGAFALGKDGRLDWQEVVDFSYQGIHDMTVVGQSLVRAFYGRPAGHSYFIGGSTGGRQALMEAQRYPTDYDGIIAIAPAVYFNHLKFAQLWPELVMAQAHHFVSKPKLQRATAAAIEAWQREQRVADDFIADPRQSHFDAKALIGTAVGGDAFTAADAAVIDQIWQGPHRPDGAFLWYGLPRGAELHSLAGTRGAPLHGVPYGMAVGWCRYFLLQDAAWDWSTLTQPEFERLMAQSIEKFGPAIETADPDLRPFRDHGGKLIIWHGWADQLIPPEGTIRYFTQVEQRMGGPAATAAFARLFMIPGVGHVGGGRGPQPFAVGAALRRWVEQGTPPTQLQGELFDEQGASLGTRSVAPFVTTAAAR